MKSLLGIGLLVLSGTWIASCVPDRSGDDAGGEPPEAKPSPATERSSSRGTGDTSDYRYPTTTSPSVSGTTTPSTSGSTTDPWSSVRAPATPTAGAGTGTTGATSPTTDSQTNPVAQATTPAQGGSSTQSSNGSTSGSTAPQVVPQPATSGSTQQNSSTDTPSTAKSDTPPGVPADQQPADIPVLGPEANQAKGSAPSCKPMYVANTGGVSISLRSGAGPQYSALEGLVDGQMVVPTASEGEWIAVQVSGKTGFVYSKFLACQPGGPPASAGGPQGQNGQAASQPFVIPNCK